MINTLKMTSVMAVSAMLMTTACGQSSFVALTTRVPQVLTAAPGSGDAVIADAGNGVKTPAKLSFSIKLSEVSGFNVKASTAGTAAKTKADLTHLKFYLAESTTGTAPAALAGTSFTYAVTATNRTNNRVDVTFTNVSANGTGNSYYVLTAGFGSSTYTAANNITNLDAPINDGTEGKYFVSNSGGDTLNPGAVRVAPTTYALSGTAALNIPLQLLDAVSPVLDSDINVSSGDEISGAPSGSGS